MPVTMQDLMQQYIEEVKKIYGTHICRIILYGSYARGDFRPDSDIDIIIGGPPCQSFSSANQQRIVNDPRNILYNIN